MRHRELKFAPEARADMANAWQLVYVNDGEQRADRVYAVMEAFCRSLGEFCEIGTKHDERMQGLRSSGIPRLERGSGLFCPAARNMDPPYCLTEECYRSRRSACEAHRDLPAVAGRREGAARPQSCHRRCPTFGPRPRRWLSRR